MGHARASDSRGHQAGVRVLTIGPLRPWGIVKTRGDARTALCDYDAPNPPQLARLWRVLGRAGLPPSWIRYDRTARGWHVVIRLRRRLRCGELVALQALLGSDPKRERYNLFRVLCGARPAGWNLLFSRKLR